MGFSRDPTGPGAAVALCVPVAPGAVELGGALPLAGNSGNKPDLGIGAVSPYQSLAQESQAQHTASAGRVRNVNAVAANGIRKDFAFIEERKPPHIRLHRIPAA